MSSKVEIDGIEYEAIQYSVVEASTPLAAGDSSGQVGTITLSIPMPDKYMQPSNGITLLGLVNIIDKEIRITDKYKGYTVGKITSAQYIAESNTIQISALSKLSVLNIYNIVAQPFNGTLDNAFEYYLSLAEVGIEEFVVIDTEDRILSEEVVSFPGWYGDLWYNMKQMAAAIDCDISLVSGLIILRPIRMRLANKGRDVTRTVALNRGNFAKNIKVYYYNNEEINDTLVYPPNGWNKDVKVISIPSGASIDEDLTLSSSVSSIQQPTMVEYVGPYDYSASVYTIVGDDGLPVSPTLWKEKGGSLTVSIGKDTQTLNIKATGAVGVPSAKGDEIKTFYVGLNDDSGAARYSTLRVLGSGTKFNKVLKTFPTGISDLIATSDTGITIDNPFISTINEVSRTGSRAVKNYTGSKYSISGSVVSINRLGDSGIIERRTYDYFAGLHTAQDYDEVDADYPGDTYYDVYKETNAGIQNDLDNQVFGNVAGARIWDETSHRWYRIREATITNSIINFSADDDLTYGDLQTELYDSTVYDDALTWFDGLDYWTVDLLGIDNATV